MELALIDLALPTLVSRTLSTNTPTPSAPITISRGNSTFPRSIRNLTSSPNLIAQRRNSLIHLQVDPVNLLAMSQSLAVPNTTDGVISIPVKTAEEKWKRLFDEAYSEPRHLAIASSSLRAMIVSSNGIKLGTPLAASSPKLSVPAAASPQPHYTRYFSPETNAKHRSESDVSKQVPKFSLLADPVTRTSPLRIFTRSRDAVNQLPAQSPCSSLGHYRLHKPSSSSTTSYSRSASMKRSIHSNAYSVSLPQAAPGPVTSRSDAIAIGGKHQFSTLTNSLLLYLQLRILNGVDEIITSWTPITYVSRLPATLSAHKNCMGVYVTPTKFISLEKISQMQPREQLGFLLLTTRSIYLFTTNDTKNEVESDKNGNGVQLGYVEYALDQVQYFDPGERLRVVHQSTVEDVVQVDVAVNQQYVGLHFTQSEVSKDDRKSESVASLTLLVRNRSVVQHIVDLVPNAVVTQQSEATDDSIRDTLLLKDGVKDISCNEKMIDFVKLYRAAPPKVATKTWSSFFGIEDEKQPRLVTAPQIINEDDSDPVRELTSSELLSSYQLAAVILHNPLKSTAFVRTCSVIRTRAYLYLFTERFDIWPVLQSQPDSPLSKGLISDIIPQLSTAFRVLPVTRISRIEKWKAWRWTAGPISQLSNLTRTGSLIMNGRIGYCEDRATAATHTTGLLSGCEDSRNPAGWNWLVRVNFRDGLSVDLVFSSSDEADIFISGFKSDEKVDDAIEVVYGDD